MYTFYGTHCSATKEGVEILPPKREANSFKRDRTNIDGELAEDVLECTHCSPPPARLGE